MAVHVIDTIKPKNNGTFPVVEAVDVKVTNSKRLDAALNDKANQSDLAALQTTVSGKASQADLTALSETVSGKASQSDLTALSNTVDTKASAADLTTLSETVSTKAAASDLATTNATVATKADASALITAAANLQTQIDNIITPVTQDAEVQNARVGADGTSYQTLKARLDTENTKSQQELSSLADYNVVGKNLYNKNEVANQKDNVYITSDAGRLSDLADWTAVLIDVEGGKKYSTRDCSGAHIAYFSTRNTNLSSMTVPQILSGYISGTTGNQAGTTIPQNAVQMSVSFPTSRKSAVQIEYGESATSYEPYVCTPAIIKSEVLAASLKCKNLIGTTGGRLYPVDLPEGTVITMSTADGSTVSTPLQLMFYDENGDYLNFYGFTVGLSKRTVTIGNTIGDVSYIAWSRDFEGQVEIGSEATTYEEYFFDLNTATSEVEKIKDYDEAIGKEVATKLSGEQGKNMFNVNTANQIAGIYISYDNGYARANESFTTYVVPVTAGDTLSFNKGGAHVCGFSIVPDITTAEVGKYVVGFVADSGFADANPKQGYTVPAGVVALTVSTSNGAQFQVEEGSTSTDYEPYVFGLPANKVIGLPSSAITTTYTIKADGSGDFTDLRECLESITDSSESNQYTISIYPGIYDIGALYTAEEQAQSKGLSIPDYVSLVGIGEKRNIILKAELETPSTSFSVLNPKNVCSLINLTIDSDSCRYTIHDDFQSKTNGKNIRNVKNCIIRGTHTQYGSVIGCGVKGNATWNYENVYIDAIAADSLGRAGNAFSIHGNTNVSTASDITFKNCRLVAHSEESSAYSNSWHTLRLLSMTNGSANGTVNVHLYGCRVDGIKLTENDASQYGAGINQYVDGYGNTIDLETQVISSDGIDYSGNVDLLS